MLSNNVKTRIFRIPRGFTLIELMVAMAITAIMVTILISITSISLDTWNRTRAELRAARQAQAMTEIMARDFEAMVVRPGNDFEWLFARSGAAVGPTGNTSPNSADLVLFTAATDRYDGKIGQPEDLGGDISTVGYSLSYKDPIDSTGPAFPTFVLYRKLVNPNETFTNLLGLSREPGNAVKFKTAFDNVAGDIDDMANFVCENIYQFSVTIHLETSDPQKTITIVEGVNSSFRLFGDQVELNGAAMSPDTKVTAVEISLTVISDSAVSALRGSATIDNEFLKKNSFQYSKLIQVPRL